MIGPSRILRLAVLVGLGLFARAIVRESRTHQEEALLLPPPPLKTGRRKASR